MASDLDLSIAACLLGPEREMFSEFQGAMGRRRAGSRVVDDSGSRHRALHYGSVFESAESGSVRGGFCGRGSNREKIHSGCIVDDSCSGRSSADGGICHFLLRFATGDGQARERDSNRISRDSRTDRFGLAAAVRDFPRSSGFAGVSRSGASARIPLYPTVAVVRMAGNSCAGSAVVVVQRPRSRAGMASTGSHVSRADHL